MLNSMVLLALALLKNLKSTSCAVHDN